MREYIIEWFGIGEQLTRLREGNVPFVLWPKRIREERRREEIVRCRDCARFVPQGTYRFNSGEVNKDSCEVIRGFVVQIDPNGFCAWGERN